MNHAVYIMVMKMFSVKFLLTGGNHAGESRFGDDCLRMLNWEHRLKKEWRENP